MTTIHARQVGEEALLQRDDLLRLVELARHAEEIDLKFEADEASTADLMRLAEKSGSFEFWNEPGEDQYTMDDGEPI